MYIKSILVLCFIGVLSIVNALEVEGFKNLKWNDSSSKLVGKKLGYNTAHDIKVKNLSYNVKKEKLLIGDAKISSISYSFFDDRFYSAYVTYKGYSNFTILEKVLEAKYGESYRPNPYLDEYKWGADGKSISLSYNDITEEGSIMILNLTIYTEATSYAKEVAIRDVNDL